MKKKNCFTLIELLAVIVILAIIALIATPIVLNLINKARKGAAQNSAYGIRQAAKLYYQKDLIDNIEGFQSIEFNCTAGGCLNDNKKLEFDGTNPSSGKIRIDASGNITGIDVTINGYICGTKTTLEVYSEKWFFIDFCNYCLGKVGTIVKELAED